MYEDFVKRPLDFLAALLALIFLSPLFLIVALGLALENRGSPFFYQTRPGRQEKLFRIVKFKTMNDDKGNDGQLLPDAERLTKTGRFVRKTSLDEIPQLINVLKGDMSVVGPRPLLPEYLELYDRFQKKRHEVKPGITGWAQVNGRNAISWHQKFEYDYFYVQNQSFGLDLKILFKTVKKVFISEGINAEGSATIEKFDGTN